MADNQQLLEGLVPAGLWGPPKLSSCIGIFIAPDAVTLASAAVSGGKPAVAKVVTVPLTKPAAPEGGEPASKKRSFFTTDFLANREALAQAIAAGLSELGARGKDVVVSFSHQISITRYFLMNPVDKRFWKTSLPLEAKKYIPFPMDGLMNDFQVAPPVSETKKNMMGVLLGVTPGLALAQAMAAIRGLGLNPVAVEPSHCSVMRAWSTLGAPLDGQAVVRVHFDKERAFVVLTRNGLPLLCREVDLPSDEYALSQKKLDLASALDFADRYLGIEEVSRIKVTGVGNTDQFMGMIGREVELPAEKDASIELPGGGSAGWGAYAAAGAAARPLGGNPLSIDFTQTGRMREEDKTLILIWGMGLATFLLCALMAFTNQYRIVRAKQELAKLTRQASDAGVTQGMSAGDLKNKIEQMKALVGKMEEMDARAPLATKLQVLADTIPENIWLENLQYSDLLSLGEPRKTALTITGSAQYGSRENDILSATQFKEALLKDETFFRGFGKLDISYSGGTGGGDSESGSRVAKKTQFTIIAGPEKF